MSGVKLENIQILIDKNPTEYLNLLFFLVQHQLIFLNLQRSHMNQLEIFHL